MPKYAITISINPWLRCYGSQYCKLSKELQRMFLLENISLPLKDVPDAIQEVYFEPHPECQHGRLHLHGTITCDLYHLEQFKNHIYANCMMKNDHKDWVLNCQTYYEGCWEGYIRKEQFPFNFIKSEYTE